MIKTYTGGVSIDHKKDIPLIAPEDIELYTYDYIVISSTKYSDEILEELLSRNICRDKILCIKDLENKIWGAYHDKLILNGVDIGGPSGLFEGIYEEARGCDIVNYSKNNIWSRLGEEFLWKNRVLGNVIEADATELGKIENDKYDFVLSSNNLEHIANPIKALKEWKRILKPDGLMFLVVPNKEFMFDHNREFVTMGHLLNDYTSNMGEDDLSHVPEILEKHDLELDKPAGTFEEFKIRCEHNFENRCLHQHVFSAQVLEELGQYLEMKIQSSILIYGQNLIVLQK